LEFRELNSEALSTTQPSLFCPFTNLVLLQKLHSVSTSRDSGIENIACRVPTQNRTSWVYWRRLALPIAFAAQNVLDMLVGEVLGRKFIEDLLAMIDQSESETCYEDDANGVTC
jgi:hypothetical protein